MGRRMLNSPRAVDGSFDSIDARKLDVPDPASFFEQAGVALFDGRPFDGEGFVRLNFGCPRATLTEALNRLQDAVRKRGRAP